MDWECESSAAWALLVEILSGCEACLKSKVKGIQGLEHQGRCGLATPLCSLWQLMATCVGPRRLAKQQDRNAFVHRCRPGCKCGGTREGAAQLVQGLLSHTVFAERPALPTPMPQTVSVLAYEIKSAACGVVVGSSD